MQNQTKFIVTEQFAGARSVTELFAELVISISEEKNWTRDTGQGIIEGTTVVSESCCSSFGR